MPAGQYERQIRPRLKFGAQLTSRQLEVLTLLAEGYLSRDIADMLSVSRKTVQGHLLICRLKLGARNGPHAVALAARQGLLPE